jgi:multicomponent Na+:H+ antiporter subunit G
VASSLADALASALPYVADALVILGVFIMTVGVYGAVRMPDTYTKLHAMSKAVFLGVISFCASSAVTGDPAIIYRAILIAAFLIVTTPISAFAIARAAYLRGERMEIPGARDESGKGLNRRTSL